MNRTDRLLAILLELQRQRNVRACDLADLFETSQRTIYRDMQALCEAGVPVVAVPGKGYALVDGYFLPPVAFSADEAAILLLGSRYVAKQFDEEYSRLAMTASAKIEAVLPEAVRKQTDRLCAGIALFESQPDLRPDERETEEKIRQLRRAILEEKRIAFTYSARYRQLARDEDVNTQREVDPYGLVHTNGAWYLVGWCHLRGDRRHFRLERIQSLTRLPQSFVRPDDFSFQQERKEQPVEVQLLFGAHLEAWVKEERSFFTVHEERREEGFYVRLRVRHEAEVLPWLLRWGGGVRVLAPESLRQRVLAEAQAVISANAPN
ncbi:helix-turn-helix transcriptional regulator [Brevibacillus fluminis]|uniref:helix-turn-helix transcriptional regulator n=1 Tax=Brevibacillus fluminis TaxID=511487 RepID=UPI003F89FD37